MGICIAIDGPVASGKGTLARKLAAALGFHLLDTGLLYRAVGVGVRQAGQDPQDEQAATDVARRLDVTTLSDDPSLRTAEAGNLASLVGVIPGVRQALLDFQREFARREPGAVLDGRDIGTVICPDAPVKLYITASAEVRATRRHQELLGRGQESVYTQVLAAIRERDERDTNRPVAPLRPADDAVIIDTSNMDPDRVLDVVLALVRERLAVTG